MLQQFRLQKKNSQVDNMNNAKKKTSRSESRPVGRRLSPFSAGAASLFMVIACGIFVELSRPNGLSLSLGLVLALGCVGAIGVLLEKAPIEIPAISSIEVKPDHESIKRLEQLLLQQNRIEDGLAASQQALQYIVDYVMKFQAPK